MSLKRGAFEKQYLKAAIQMHVKAYEYFQRMNTIFGPTLVMCFIMIAIFLCANSFILLEVRIDLMRHRTNYQKLFSSRLWASW